MPARVALLSLTMGFCLWGRTARAAESKVLTQHLGYEPGGPKHAVILGRAADSFSECALRDSASDRTDLIVPARAAGPVKKWRDWYFWTVDFDSSTAEGEYYDCASRQGSIRSFPFRIQRLILERNTLSDVIYLLQR